MKTFLKISAITIGVILVAGVAAYFTWFKNSYEHTLQLSPDEIYAEKNEGILITNANIIDVMYGEVRENQHVLIQNGTFDRIFEGTNPDSLNNLYTVVDAENQYLLPGLIDMHAHLNSGGLIPPEPSTRLIALEQFAQYGVSTVFTLGGHGFEQQITADLISQQENHELVGPQIFATGDILTSPGGYPIPMVPMMTGLPPEEIVLSEQGIVTVTDETDLNALFSRKKELGLNGVKIMVESGLAGASEEPRLSNDQLRYIIQAASAYDLPVFAHVSRQDDLWDAVNAGVDVIVHTVGDQLLTDAGAIFEKMKTDSVYYTPTLSIAYMYQYTASAEILDDPFLQRFSSERTDRSLENWPIRQMMVMSSGIDPESMKEVMLQNFKQFLDAGVPILMGSDAGNPSVIPGYSAHNELKFMAEQGMSNINVLRSATIDPAKFLGIQASHGSIEEGKSASFLMLDDNPLEDITNSRSINRVMLEGYWIE